MKGVDWDQGLRRGDREMVERNGVRITSSSSSGMMEPNPAKEI